MKNPTFHLEGIVKSSDEMQDFTGPLTLILMLLSKNKIEIRDLKISEILDQYLEHISKMQEMDLDIASEFVQMASHLVYIKTRTLLSGDEEVSELEELMSSLEQIRCHDAYMSIKAVTEELSRMSQQGLLMFSKEPEPLKTFDSGEYRYSHQPQELINALFSVFSKNTSSGQETPSMPKRIIYGVRQKSSQLIELLRNSSSIPLRELYEISRSRSELIATFISVLELCSHGSISLYSNGGEMSVTLIGEPPEDFTEETFSE
ncbi:MAG: segregation/condensation protein A [Clostridiales bacterium]|nr:segregation/condensation protein A [Clostridiales bacterium]